MDDLVCFAWTLVELTFLKKISLLLLLLCELNDLPLTNF